MGRGKKVSGNSVNNADAALAKRTGLTVERIRELRELFSLVDVDGSENITPEELMALTELMNMHAAPEEIDQMVTEIDSSGTRQISFEDFVMAISRTPKVSYSPKEVIDAFKLLAGPSSRDGHIQVNTLDHALMNFGPGMSFEQASEITGRAEVGKDGSINYDEFVRVMMDVRATEEVVRGE